MKKNRDLRKRHGFTLVELLVVISIIALLLSVLMPTLTKVRLQAQSAVCKSNLSNLGKAFFVYAAKYDGWFPVPQYDLNNNGSGWDLKPPEYWVAALKSARVFDSLRNNDPTAKTGLGFEKAVWSCPTDKNAYTNALGTGLSYGMNDGWTNRTDQTSQPFDILRYNFKTPINSLTIKTTSATVLVADVTNTWCVYTWRWYSTTIPNKGSFTLRHNTGSNFALVDGHVEHGKAEKEQIKINVCRPVKFRYNLDR